MGFFDSLKSVFIVPEETGSKPNNTQAAGTGSSAESSSHQVNVNETPKEITDQFYQILSGVLEKHNEPGFDYFEYRKALASVSKMQNLERDVQYKSAYAAAQALNVESKQLIDSAKKYLGVLELESTHFQQTAKQYLQEQEKSFEKETQQLKDQIQSKEKELEKLNLELANHNKRLLDIEGEITAARSRVELNQAGFNSSYIQLVKQIEEDIENMIKYLN